MSNDTTSQVRAARIAGGKLDSAVNKERGIFIVISAPSGTGKTTICRKLLEKWPSLNFSVSYTTRAPRPDEKDGESYRFISDANFREKIVQGEFAEWVENYGCLYGTSKITMESSLEKGGDLLIDVEPRGAKSLKKNFPGGIFVFILPPSWAELEKRLIGRGFEEEKVVRERLRKAREECREVGWYDYALINDNLSEAVDKLSAIYVAEKTRRERLQGRINDLLSCS